MGRYSSLICLLIFLFQLTVQIPLVSAQLTEDAENDVIYQKDVAGAASGYDVLSLERTSLQRAVGRIINYVAGLIGTLLLVLIVYGAYEWMTAAGNDDQITKAKDTIKRAIIGAAILLAAYAITRLVVTTVIYSTQKSIIDTNESQSELEGEWNEMIPGFDPFDEK